MIINPQKIIDQKIVTGEGLKVQQNGIDLTVKTIENEHMHKVETFSDVAGDEYFRLEAKQCYSITTNQETKIPSGMAAMIIHRSSLNRGGCFVQSGLYDSGFDNSIGFMLYCFRPLVIPKNERVAQIVFMEADEASLYDGQYQRKNNIN